MSLHPTEGKIINAALKLFGRNGIDSTNIESILREAKISRGTFYKYFKSKSDLLIKIRDLKKISSVNTWLPTIIPGYDDLTPESKLETYLVVMFSVLSDIKNPDLLLYAEVLLDPNKQKLFNVDISEHMNGTLEFFKTILQDMNIENPESKAKILMTFMDGLFFAKMMWFKNPNLKINYRTWIRDIKKEVMNFIKKL